MTDVQIMPVPPVVYDIDKIHKEVIDLSHELLHNNGEGSMPFFGHFLSQLCKVYSEKIPAPAGVTYRNGRFIMCINPVYFKSDVFTRAEWKGILRHEVEHLIREHLFLHADIRKQDAPLLNVAEDCAINQYIPELKNTKCIHLEDLRKEEGLSDLLAEETSEYYYYRLKDAIQKQKEKNNGQSDIEDKYSDKVLDDHNWQEEGQLSETEKAIRKQQIIEYMKRSMEYAKSNGAGRIPLHILKLFNELCASTVNWKQQLRRFVAKTQKYSREQTRKKRNRRFGLAFPGIRKTPKLSLALCVDESGSIDDEIFKQFFSEIDYISQFVQIWVIQCDTEVNKVYEYKKNSPVERTGQGGTLYNPAIIKATELKVDGIIFFGDGDCFDNEEVIKPKVPMLWAMEEGRDPPVSWGARCSIKRLLNDN